MSKRKKPRLGKAERHRKQARLQEQVRRDEQARLQQQAVKENVPPPTTATQRLAESGYRPAPITYPTAYYSVPSTSIAAPPSPPKAPATPERPLITPPLPLLNPILTNIPWQLPKPVAPLQRAYVLGPTDIALKFEIDDPHARLMVHRLF